jgi:hypothetical protein
MMDERPHAEPTEYVIWSAGGLLALVVGLGAAFTLWTALGPLAQTGLAVLAVGALGAGLLLIGLAVPKPFARMILLVFAAALLTGFAFGGTQFGRLTP